MTSPSRTGLNVLRSRFWHNSRADFLNHQKGRNLSSTVSQGESVPFPSTSRQTLPRHDVEIGSTNLSRLQEHYNNTLARDLLYMTYNPSRSGTAGPSSSFNKSNQREWDSSSPYTKNRPSRPMRGNRSPQPSSEMYDREIVKLERIVITAFCKEAIANKHALIPLAAQFRSITGLNTIGSLADPNLANISPKSPSSSPASKKGYLNIVRAKSGVASFKLRPGMPVGVQAVLPAAKAYEFLEVLVTFVLPRLRTFGGFPLPPASQPPMSPAALSGVVSLGMSPEAMALFPQTEINWDAYPGKPLGFQIDCITNQRGRRATEKARKLVSGLGIPFVRRGGIN